MTLLLSVVLAFVSMQARPASAETRLPASIRIHVVDGSGQIAVAGADVTVSGEGRVIRGVTDVRGECSLDISLRRFRIRASAPGYVQAEYGALSAGEPGTEISLGNTGDSTFTVVLMKSGFLAGRVVGLFGEPLPDVLVSALADGGKPVQQWTDYKGEFKLYALPPGEYLVSARPQLRFLYPAAMPSESQIDKALDRLRLGLFDPGPDDGGPDDRLRSLPTVYYPGTVNPELAVKLSIGVGTELFGIDLRLLATGASSVSGRLDGLSGTIGVGSVMVAINIATGASYGGSVSDRGAFSFSSLPPGTYRIRSRILDGSRKESSAEPRVTWGETTVQVPSPDGREVVVRLQDPLELHGRLTVAGSTALSGSFRLMLERVDLLSTSRMRLSAVIGEGGSFVVAGVDPGTYRFLVEGSASDGAQWQLRQAVSGTTDLIGPFPVSAENAPTNIALSVSSAIASLTGTISNDYQAPVSGYYVLVFPVLPTLRVPKSPRLVLTRPSSNGRYECRDLPPGDYFISVLSGRPADWDSAGFLSLAEASAIKVAVHEGSVTTQDLQVRREMED